MFRAHELSHTLKTKVEGTPEEFWPFFEFIQLQDIFEAAGSLPGIERTSPFTEWHTPGNKRTVYFTTGDTATEEILECTVPNHFKYKVCNTTLSARYFVKEIIGEWHIIGDKGHTNVTWQYQFFPKSVIHRLFILNFFKHSWIPYMELSMRLLQEQYDTYRHQRTPRYEKGLCESCCEYAMSDDDLREMVEFRGYKMTDRMTEAFEGKSDNFNKCMEKLLNISVLIEEFESGKLDSEKTMRLIKDIVEAPVYP